MSLVALLEPEDVVPSVGGSGADSARGAYSGAAGRWVTMVN